MFRQIGICRRRPVYGVQKPDGIIGISVQINPLPEDLLIITPIIIINKLITLIIIGNDVLLTHMLCQKSFRFRRMGPLIFPVNGLFVIHQPGTEKEQ